MHTHGGVNGHAGELNSRPGNRLTAAGLITLVFVVVEVAAGIRGNSLALLTDAAHNFTDVVALGLTWFALRLADRSAHAGKTYGYHRAGILVALVNSSTLVLIAGLIFVEALERIRNPIPVDAGLLTFVGLVALGVNLFTAWLVRPGSREDLNLRSAYYHLLGDVISTVGAILAGIAIFLTGLNWIDPLVSILIAILILWAAWSIVRESLDILLEGTPRDIDMEKMVLDVMGVEGVQGIHDLHVWSLTQNIRNLSAHVVTADIPLSEGAVLQSRINEILNQNYRITHATLQLECPGCEPDLLFCEMEGEGNP
jgi:cobalt-zinc-cadmium efflux system protein